MKSLVEIIEEAESFALSQMPKPRRQKAIKLKGRKTKKERKGRRKKQVARGHALFLQRKKRWGIQAQKHDDLIAEARSQGRDVEAEMAQHFFQIMDEKTIKEILRLNKNARPQNAVI